MSTKIYYAYRMSVKTFSEAFLPAFRKHVFEKATAFTKSLLDEGFDAKSLRRLFVKMTQASRSKLREYECIDASFNAWIHKGKVYVIPYGERHLVEDFKPPQGVEDYCYWNNTDEPENVTGRQWNQRGKTWEEVCLSEKTGWDSGRLVHEIINVSTKQGLVEIGTALLDVEKAWKPLAQPPPQEKPETTSQTPKSE